MKSAGLSAVPFHDNVPSFGEWGWYIGGHAERTNEETIRKRLRNSSGFKVPTQYLTPAVMNASFEFGVNQLKTENTEINTITNSLAFSYYVNAWQ